MVLKKSSNNVWVKRLSVLVKITRRLMKIALTCKKSSQKIFKNFGIIPELIGRLPVFAALEQLTVDDLVRILKEPRNALVKQYQPCFLMMMSSWNLTMKPFRKLPIRPSNGRLGRVVFARSSKKPCWTLCLKYRVRKM